MKLWIQLVALAICLLSTSFTQAQQSKTSAGTYTTYVGEQLFGTDNYTLTTNADGSTQAQADITFGPTKMKAVTRVAGKTPVNFTMEIAGALVLTVEIGEEVVRIKPQGQAERELRGRPTVLLENGAWHQFFFLFSQYDYARGGQQSFSALLPSQAILFTMNLERIDAPIFKVGTQQVATEHFRAGTNLGLDFEIWTDAAHVPLLITVAAQRLKIVHKGAEKLAEAIIPPPSPGPAPSANDPFTSEEVTFQNGEQKLAATLTVPKKGKAPFPGLVIISGSGAQDRDGTALVNLYRLIAERLSAGGVAVLRADDRGAGKSSMPTRPTSYRDLINDSKAAFEFLMTRNEIDRKRIGLVGHSEGAETALIIAAEDPRAAAVILLAGTSKPVDRVLTEQTLYGLGLQAPVNPSDKAKYPAQVTQLEKLFQDAKSQPKPAANDQLAWFREHAENDPLALARRVRVPVLVLNGERDDNVLPYHALNLAQALADSGNKQVMLRIFPNLTHVFTPSQRDKSVADSQAVEVSSEFLDLLQRWAESVLVHGRDGGTVPEK